MNEREMLEMAAKAAGINGYIYEWIDGPTFVIPGENPVYFNPLKDDGEALRLAVKLDMQIIVNRVDGFVRVIAGYNGEIVIEEEFGDDMYAATRLAITRAAAQIGKSMP